MKRIKAIGTIDQGGSLKLKDRNRIKTFLQHHKGKDVIVTIDVDRHRRTNAQNAYYWAVVVPEVVQALRDAGYDIIPGSVDDERQVHELLKSKFGSRREIVNDEGVILEMPASTASMSVEEFSAYIDRITRWAAEFLGAAISQP